MARSFQEVEELKNSLKSDYEDRHAAFRKLRAFWHGQYWADVDSDAHGIASIFKDLTSRQSDVGPDIKLVRNLIFEVCAKYQSFLSPLPMIRVYVDPPTTNLRKNQATTKERFLYGCWSENKATKLNGDIAWYLPLMGSCFHGIFPDMDRRLPRMLLRSPEHAYPVPAWDGGDEAYIFSWKISEAQARAQWPDIKLKRDKARGRFRRGQKPNDDIQVLEYSDGKEFARWVDETKVNGVEHDYGFNLFEHMKFINVPDEVWGHGAVEQAVNLVEMGNALYSLMFQAVMENVFPKLVLIDPSKAPEEIEEGPGAVLPLNAGGDAKYLTPPVAAVGTHMAFLQENERAVMQDTSMPAVNFGQSPASSIVTGKAINELQGAGTGSLVEMVQGIGIGAGLVAWNEKAIHMSRTMWADETMYLYGTMPGSITDLNPRQFPLKVKGKELVGGIRNEVVFAPHLSMHEKLVMMLQGMGAGLFSKQYSREQVGVPDSEAMEEEMVTEAINDAVLSGIVAALQAAGAPPEQGEQAAQQALDYIAGTSTPSNFSPMTPNPEPMLPDAGGNEFPIGPIAPGATGQVFAPAMNMPPGSPAPANMGAAPALAPAGEPAPNAIALDDAVQAFQGLQNIAGRVFLVGEIVQTGQTDDDIEVALTNPGDRQAIADQLPQYAGLIAFITVQDEPQETYIEVTPGQEPMQGGADVDIQLDDDEEVLA